MRGFFYLDRMGREVYPERNEMEPKEVQEEERIEPSIDKTLLGFFMFLVLG